MKIIYATTNENKKEEMEKLWKGYPIEFLSLQDIGFQDEIIEDGNTFSENSLKKALVVFKFCQDRKINFPILADDAGLCVTSLDNRPGIFTARYAGDHAPQLLCLQKMLEELKDKTDRSATFYCALTLIYQDKCYQVEGKMTGQMDTSYHRLGGFTFSPIFIPDGYQRPLIELSNIKTHRADAVWKLISILKNEKSFSEEDPFIQK